MQNLAGKTQETFKNYLTWPEEERWELKGELPKSTA